MRIVVLSRGDWGYFLSSRLYLSCPSTPFILSSPPVILCPLPRPRTHLQTPLVKYGFQVVEKITSAVSGNIDKLHGSSPSSTLYGDKGIKVKCNMKGNQTIIA